ncbi:UNVERIFIED_CONTAM: hypothetical protein Slati_2784500 [Sesamum latifolium]|uniref:RNase H type-1 domain-containing protein n=1 Tax=Sesamum latifolium TaxID=2727402 RepID=A0AAW2VY50_9LAMI
MLMVFVWLDCLSSRLNLGSGELVEALAAREVVPLALRRGWRSVVFESDCANLVKKLQAPGKDLSFIGSIVSDVHNLASCLRYCRFSLLKQSANSVAHFIAQIARGYVEGGHVIPLLLRLLYL